MLLWAETSAPTSPTKPITTSTSTSGSTVSSSSKPSKTDDHSLIHILNPFLCTYDLNPISIANAYISYLSKASGKPFVHNQKIIRRCSTSKIYLPRSTTCSLEGPSCSRWNVLICCPKLLSTLASRQTPYRNSNSPIHRLTTVSFAWRL